MCAALAWPPAGTSDKREQQKTHPNGRNQQAANERLVLFAAARAVLRSGMKILGLVKIVKYKSTSQSCLGWDGKSFRLWVWF